jgi:hypothetical protein
VSYRDDIDALYTRATVLQRELEAAQQKLADRDAELARLRDEPFAREDTSPGLRQLREAAPAETLLSRLIAGLPTQAEDPDQDRWEPETPVSNLPPPEWLVRQRDRLARLETTRAHLGELDDEALALVGSVVEELASRSSTLRPEIVDRLRPIVQAISAAYWRRPR